MEFVHGVACPVCTLYLRPGVTLESHLSTHTKESVIEALAKASLLKDTQSSHTTVLNTSSQINTTTNTIAVKAGDKNVNIASTQSEISVSAWQQIQQQLNGNQQAVVLPVSIAPIQQTDAYGQNQPLFYQQTFGNLSCATAANTGFINVLPNNQPLITYTNGFLNGQPVIFGHQNIQFPAVTNVQNPLGSPLNSVIIDNHLYKDKVLRNSEKVPLNSNNVSKSPTTSTSTYSQNKENERMLLLENNDSTNVHTAELVNNINSDMTFDSKIVSNDIRSVVSTNTAVNNTPQVINDVHSEYQSPQVKNKLHELQEVNTVEKNSHIEQAITDIHLKTDNRFISDCVANTSRQTINPESSRSKIIPETSSKRPVITLNLNDSVTLTSNSSSKINSALNRVNNTHELNVIVTNKLGNKLKVSNNKFQTAKDERNKNRIIDNVILPEITIIATDSGGAIIKDGENEQDEAYDATGDIEIISSESIAEEEFSVITANHQTQQKNNRLEIDMLQNPDEIGTPMNCETENIDINNSTPTFPEILSPVKTEASVTVKPSDVNSLSIKNTSFSRVSPLVSVITNVSTELQANPNISHYKILSGSKDANTNSVPFNHYKLLPENSTKEANASNANISHYKILAENPSRDTIMNNPNVSHYKLLSENQSEDNNFVANNSNEENVITSNEQIINIPPMTTFSSTKESYSKSSNIEAPFKEQSKIQLSQCAGTSQKSNATRNTLEILKTEFNIKPEPNTSTLKNEVIILNEEVFIGLPGTSSQFRKVTRQNSLESSEVPSGSSRNTREIVKSVNSREPLIESGEIVIKKIETFSAEIKTENNFTNDRNYYSNQNNYYPDNGENFPQRSSLIFMSDDRKSYETDLIEFNDVKLLLGESSIMMRENESSNRESPRILLNLENDIKTDFNQYSSHSIESLSIIRTDEKMPSKSELSEQESSIESGEAAVWQRNYQQETGYSDGASYDILARESWDTSSDRDLAVIQAASSSNPSNLSSFHDDYYDVKETNKFIKAPVYKCMFCSETFYCQNQRRNHMHSNHGQMDLAALSEGTSSSTHFLNNSAGNIFTTVRSAMKSTAEILSNSIKEELNDIKPTLPLIKTERNELNFDTKPPAQSDPPSYNEVILNTRMKSDVVTVCTQCNYDFQTIALLRAHHRIDHVNTPLLKFQCVKCSEMFTGENDYNNHLSTVHPLVCPLCNKNFTVRASFRSHIRRHTQQETNKKFKCSECPRSFADQKNFEQHSLCHKLTCATCKETFSDRFAFMQHKIMHHKFKLKIKKEIKKEIKEEKPNLGKKDYICNHCGEIFPSEKKVRWHEEIHDPKPKACMHCSEKFVHRASLTRHIRHTHNKNYRFIDTTSKTTNEKELSPNVECKICHNIYLKTSLSLHLKLHTGVRPFTCNICNKSFTTKWNLKLHRWTHASRTSKPFKCQVCSSGFIRHNDYISHMNSHKNVRPYTCNICGRQFIRKYNCLRHVKEHEGDKIFKCKVCHKEFHRSYYLRDHMNMHGGIKPYNCHICGKKSSTKSNHNKHVKIHHAREPVSTEG